MTPITALTRYIALYCRISKDKTGKVEGVSAQIKWGMAYAAEHWPGIPVRVFKDNNISAAGDDYREGYEDLRAAIRRGEVLNLWCVEQSRLERKETGWFELAAELDAAGITELHTRHDGVVRVQDDVAGIKAILAAGEVRRLKQRVNARLDEIAGAGRPAGGYTFGYRRGINDAGDKTLVIVEEEAAIIRDAAERLLAGWSLEHIATRLRDAGMTGPRGGKIEGNRVRAWLMHPTVAGIRVHRGQELRRGNWPAILDAETREAVLDRLNSPRTVARANGGSYTVQLIRHSTARRYLLVGTAYCDACGAALVASRRTKGGKSKSYYICHKKVGGRGCVMILGDDLEQYVAQQLLARLDTPAFRAALAEDNHQAERDAISTRLRACQARRKTLAARWGAGGLTDEEWDAARAAQEAQEANLRAKLAAIPPATVGVDVDAVIAGWDAMTLDERREIVHLFVEKVIVKRALRQGLKRFDDNRVGKEGIVWRKV